MIDSLHIPTLHSTQFDYGWIFLLWKLEDLEMIATYQNLLSLPHVCRCMYPDFVVWDQRSRRSACAPHSLINKNIKHFVGPDLGPNCQLLLSTAYKVSRTAWCLRSKPPLLLLARGGLGFAHKTWLPSQKGLSGGGGVQLWQRFFFSWWWERGSKHHKSGPSLACQRNTVKLFTRQFNGVSLIDNPTWNADLVALWF